MVLLHVAAPFVTEGVRTAQFDFDFGVGNCVDSFTRICVPLFVLISGMFLLGRHETPLESYRKRASKMLIPLLFWSGFYLLYQYLIGMWCGPVLMPKQLLLLLIDGNPFYHLWYLYMITGLYLITPFINQFIERSSETQQWIVAGVLVVFAMVNTTFDAPFGTPPVFLFWFINYLGYFFLGYLLARHRFAFNSTLLLGIYFLSGSLIAWITPYTIREYGNLYFYGYNSPLVFVGAVSVFLIVQKAEIETNVFSRVSHLTFGVYLFHAFVLDAFNRLIAEQNWSLMENALTGIPIRFMLVTLASFATVHLLYKSRLFRQCI